MWRRIKTGKEKTEHWVQHDFNAVEWIKFSYLVVVVVVVVDKDSFYWFNLRSPLPRSSQND